MGLLCYYLCHIGFFISFVAMKRFYLIIGIALLFLASCTQSTQDPEDPLWVEGPSQELSAIDSLMWQRPDSALTLLLPYFDTACRDGVHTVSTAYDWHYANLLLSELLYKNDSTQTTRAELLKAVDYFDSLLLADACNASLRGFCRRDTPRMSANRRHPTAFLAARAHYINGVGYYENDSAVDACKEYLKALEVMEGCFDEVEIIGNKANLMALLFVHLTGVFSDQYLHEQSIYFGKKSLKYFKKYDAVSWNVSWVLDEIGSHFDVLGDYDSAGYYYNQGLVLLSDTNSINYRDLTTRLAFLSYKKEKDPTLSLYQLFSMLSQAESKKNMFLVA